MQLTKDNCPCLFSFSSDYTNIPRFLNRILGVEVELQNRLFAYFMKTLSVVVQQAKSSGRWDEGILGKRKREGLHSFSELYERETPDDNLHHIV